MNETIQQTFEILNMRPTNEPQGLLKALQASNVVYSDDEEYIQFSVKGDRDINKVKVILNEGDLFDVEFYNINLKREEMVKKLDEFKDLFNDQLVDAIWKRVVIV